MSDCPLMENKPDRPKWSNRLIAERDRIGYTQDQAASVLGVSSRTLRRWESNPNYIRATEFRRAMHEYGEVKSQ